MGISFGSLVSITSTNESLFKTDLNIKNESQKELTNKMRTNDKVFAFADIVTDNDVIDQVYDTCVMFDDHAD